MESKRVLVTGAGGFSGQSVMAQLKRLGWEVVPLLRRSSGMSGERVVDFDSADAAALLEGLPPCNAIVHLATRVDFSPDAELKQFFGTNVLATTLLANLARRWDAHFVLASGTLVHGAMTRVDASTPLSPAIPYAEAKLLAEQIVTASVDRYAILRIAGIYGYGGPAHLGLNRAISAAVDSEEVPELYGDGLGKRNYIYVDDLADSVATVIEQRIEGVHLVAGREPLTIAQMLQQLCDTFIPGSEPLRLSGGRSVDSVVEPSPALPAGHTFLESLEQIKSQYGR